MQFRTDEERMIFFWTVFAWVQLTRAYSRLEFVSLLAKILVVDRVLAEIALQILVLKIIKDTVGQRLQSKI